MNVEEALAIVNKFLEQGRLNKIQETVLRQSWEGQSYLEIASNFGYDYGYVRDAGSKLWQLLSRAFEEKVTKKNFQLILKQRWHRLRNGEPQLLRTVAFNLIAAEGISANQNQDWGEAVDVSVFYGRVAELATLEQWIVQDRCRLVALFGMGGIGKTALSVRVAQQIQDEFEYLFLRSLRNAPPIQSFLAELSQFLSKGQETDLPETVDGRILRVIEHLRSSRCLLLLDNAETILRSGDHTGGYREGYEEYGQLLRCVAETPHHSCLVLTSREKPRGLAAKSGETLPVRSLQLTGLPIAEGRELFKAIGDFWASESEWRVLIEHYAGNPLALKMVAPVIRDLCDGSVAKFLELLKQDTLVFDDIRHLLERQFNRLSNLEKEVMYWLAINREPIFPKLPADFLPNVRQWEILEALASLHRRSLIVQSPSGFTQQPIVMEYMTEKARTFIERSHSPRKMTHEDSMHIQKAFG